MQDDYQSAACLTGDIRPHYTRPAFGSSKMASRLARCAGAPADFHGIRMGLANRGVAQLVARLLWEQEVPGSNPGTPTLSYVYILRSFRTQRYYVGSTQDVENRLHKHNSGKSQSTRAGAPWELILSEKFPTRSDAVVQEQKNQSARHRTLSRRLASNTLELARGASAPRSRVQIPAPRLDFRLYYPQAATPRGGSAGSRKPSASTQFANSRLSSDGHVAISRCLW